MPTPTTILLLLLLLLLFLSSTTSSATLHRRILHQPFLPQDSPPPIPPSPSPPFSTPTPPDNNDNNSPFFPSYPSPPSSASFPANISSLSVPHSKPTHTSSSKLIPVAVAAVLAALVVLSLALFLHLRRRRSTPLNLPSKSPSHTATSFNQTAPTLQRPSQTSSEFLYLGTLVNSHAVGTSRNNYGYPSDDNRKLDSPEIRPLPPLNTQQQGVWRSSSNGGDNESTEEFYSPKGSVNGGESSIGAESVSGRIGAENFDGSVSNSSSNYTSSVPESDSPANNLSPRSSVPKSPDLIETQTTAPAMGTGCLLFRESASPSPPNSTSPERYSRRSDELSSNASDQNAEHPVRMSSPDRNKSSAVPSEVEMHGLAFRESSSSPLRPSSSSSMRSDESSPPRISNVSDQNVGTISSPVQHEAIVMLTQPEMESLASDHESDSQLPVAVWRYSRSSEGSSPRISNASSDQNVEEMQDSMPHLESPLPLPLPLPLPPQEERSSRGSEESSSQRDSNVSDDQNLESPVRISNSVQDNAISTSLDIIEGVSQESTSPNEGNDSLSLEKNSTSEESSSPRISNASDQNMESLMKTSDPVSQPLVSFPPPVNVPSPPPPPPPPPPSKLSESPRISTPSAKTPVLLPALTNPSRPIAVESSTLISPIELPPSDSQTVKSDEDKLESPNKETECLGEDVERNGEITPKPKLKPLHWDKVRASSDREMVWDQLKCSSFKLNEEMIETLFVVNAQKSNTKETTRWQVLPSPGQDNGNNRVLDPKKAQNIAILLKALHVTVDEVCDGLLEGNADILGTELLESLLKMAPTKEEERKLKEYKDDSPVKLGAAERFLKEVVDVPFAFKRVEAMLYIANFGPEVEYLKKSYATLEAACEELRTSRIFLKLLEAVLKTGNRMNVGTNRGDAHAFKLDTLLKLVDVKGADGKTTLLHFVVQEIIRSEGARLSEVGVPHENPSMVNDDSPKCRKLGLQIVSSLSSELSNVKKAAVMDADILSSDISKLSKGIKNIREIVALNDQAMSLEECKKFSESMNGFIGEAEEEIIRVQAQESVALSLVKEITEYFHGDSAKEEAHPFRIFMVVREFLTILDRVCKDVGMINERTIVSSAHKFPVPVNPMLQKRRDTSSNDDESVPLNV